MPIVHRLVETDVEPPVRVGAFIRSTVVQSALCGAKDGLAATYWSAVTCKDCKRLRKETS